MRFEPVAVAFLGYRQVSKLAVVKRLVSPPKLPRGDKVAVLSLSFAAPAVAPAVHEQALSRLVDVVGVVPVEYETTRKLGASPKERADDFDSALSDPSIRAILATIGGSDQIRVVPHLDVNLLIADPEPFVGYSEPNGVKLVVTH